MLVRIGQRTDHGFDTPIGLLSDCHRRIERFLGALVTVTEERRGSQLPAADRAVLQAALRYFATAAPNHSADEEKSLFPRLRGSADPQAREALETVERLEADHRVADIHHTAVDELGRRWLAAGTLPPPDASALREHLVAIEQLYRRHIKVEDEELFPAAGRLLGPADLEAIGREMADRRNVPFQPPAGLAG